MLCQRSYCVVDGVVSFRRNVEKHRTRVRCFFCACARDPHASKQVAAFGDIGVGCGVVDERTFGGLNADVGHGLFGGALHIAVAAGCDTDYRAFGDVENLVVDLEAAAAAEDDVVLFVVAVAVEKRHFGTRRKRAERDFARCGGRGLLYKLFAFMIKICLLTLRMETTILSIARSYAVIIGCARTYREVKCLPPSNLC